MADGAREPVDPDAVSAGVPVVLLAVIAFGGGLGGLARYGLGVALPVAPGGVPWATLAANVAGCALIGVLMVVVSRRRGAPRLLRPFLGIGVLGGFTTFSTYALQVQGLLLSGAVPVGLLYLLATPLGGLLATIVAVRCTRLVTRPG